MFQCTLKNIQSMTHDLDEAFPLEADAEEMPKLSIREQPLFTPNIPIPLITPRNLPPNSQFTKLQHLQ